ncbi:MAG: GCN5-related N-acetyltransferase [Daejeonella sp.]|nr:GCN5-related N-acetyltransferase [Daejeonella sp.]
MEIINCSRDYSNQILEIFNDAILNSTALYDYKPRTMDNMEVWFILKEKSNFPVIGLVDDQNTLLGFGSYGTFRAWPAYKYTVEHTLYIHPNHRGKGLGKILLAEILKNAKQQDYHCLIAGIDSTNEASIKLHKSFGFEFSGRIKHAGYKFSKWLDLDFYQLLLDTPLQPNEE